MTRIAVTMAIAIALLPSAVCAEWEFREQRDQITDEVMFTIHAGSTNKAADELALAYGPASLGIGCSKLEGFMLLITAPGMLAHDGGNVPVVYRIDKKPAVAAEWLSLHPRPVALIAGPGSQKLAREFAQGTKLLFRLPWWSGGRLTWDAEFDLTGLAEKLAVVETKCGVSSTENPAATPAPTSDRR